MKLFVLVLILNLGKAESEKANSEENLPTLCHVCKHTVIEFLEELENSANSRDVLQLGQVLQSDRHKTIVYHKSGLRLIEAQENTCQKIKDYKVHKDKPNHLRYAKDESSTFTTLKNLKKRGVKVNLGFPDEMWDTPDAEIVALKKQCENIVENYEEYLNDWYFNHQENNLFDWFCKEHVLKGKDQACLKGTNSKGESESKEEKAKKRKVDDDDDDDDDDDEKDDDEKNDKDNDHYIDHDHDNNDDDDDDNDDDDDDDDDDDNDHDDDLGHKVKNIKERKQGDKKRKEKNKRDEKKWNKEKKKKKKRFSKNQKKKSSSHGENMKNQRSEL